MVSQTAHLPRPLHGFSVVSWLVHVLQIEDDGCVDQRDHPHHHVQRCEPEVFNQVTSNYWAECISWGRNKVKNKQISHCRVMYRHSRICRRWHKQNRRRRCTSCPRWSQAWGGGRCRWGRCRSRWRRWEASARRSCRWRGWGSRRLPPTPDPPTPRPTVNKKIENVQNYWRRWMSNRSNGRKKW